MSIEEWTYVTETHKKEMVPTSVVNIGALQEDCTTLLTISNENVCKAAPGGGSQASGSMDTVPRDTDHRSIDSHEWYPGDIQY